MRGLAERLIVSRTGMRVRQWERTLSRSVTPGIASRSLITDYCYSAVIETDQDQETPETIMSFVPHIRHWGSCSAMAAATTSLLGSVFCLGVINDTMGLSTVSIFSRSKYRLCDVTVLK